MTYPHSASTVNHVLHFDREIMGAVPFLTRQGMGFVNKASCSIGGLARDVVVKFILFLLAPICGLKQHFLNTCHNQS